MYKKSFQNYRVEDFITDESFINYHFHRSEEDRIFWEGWLIKNPSKRLIANEASEIIRSLSLTLSEKEYGEEFNKIKVAINRKEINRFNRVFGFLNWNKTFNSDPGKKRSMRYATVTLLVLTGGAIFFFTKSPGNHTIPLSQTINSGSKDMTFTLSDSTVVTLAPNSTLQYPLSFEGKNRQVYLNGEANFHVKRNEQFPFKVHAKDIVTTVLGTIFNIKPAGDSAIVVELLKGNVKVEIEDSTNKLSTSILLNPNEKATYVFQDKLFYKITNPAKFSVSFQQNNFDQIAAQIKNVFGITIINQSDKKNWRFTGDFKNTTAKEIIENICLIKNLNSKVVGDTIFINN